MPPLSSLFPAEAFSMLEIITNIVAILGAIMITYGVFLETEKRQDLVFIIGAGCLLVYALWIGNLIFSIAMAGFMVGSLVELVEIIIKKHRNK